MFSFIKDSFNKIRDSLAKTRNSFKEKLLGLFQKPWDENTLEELERILFEADIGSTCTMEAIEYVKKRIRLDNPRMEDLQQALQEYTLSVLKSVPETKKELNASPKVILMVGINGSGKTTTCAKLARMYKAEGKKVLLAAADTFRAAAVEQLDLWAKKVGVDIVKSQHGSDPSAVAFDALQAAKARSTEVAIIDTAGRLQNKADLMNELEKIRRVMGKVVEEAPHETYLILDATNGQNALDQAKIFNSCTPITGIILTKIDGSAKGGVVIPLSKELKLPILFLGVGEDSADLIPFSKEDFVQGLFSE